MSVSPELAEWLKQREKLLKFKRDLRADGGHVMLRSDSYDPEELEEPLRSEALQYFENKNKNKRG